MNIREWKQINWIKLAFMLTLINCWNGLIGAFQRATKKWKDWFLNSGFQGQEPRLPGQHRQVVLKWEPNVPWRFGNGHFLMKIVCYHRELKAAAQQTFGE